jgi:hypothetical protein
VSEKEDLPLQAAFRGECTDLRRKAVGTLVTVGCSLSEMKKLVFNFAIAGFVLKRELFENESD